ncbi:MAG: putative ABC transporter permease [Oscillospiraceae bacterium]|nr:putative ABC transporter permease [Oscillospiraceae bacterium]MBQ8978251.1 putative ABC transporter permease [Oscillospiraceae bacterium]
MMAQFIICGFVGWVYETVLTSAVFGYYVDRGVLNIPLLPIYGVFALILPFVFPRNTSWLKIFFAGTAGATVFELAASYLTEAVLGYRLWDYYDWKFNLDGRICLGASLIFGLMILLYMKVIEPLTLYMSKNGGVLFTIAVWTVAVGAAGAELYLMISR